MCINIVLLKIQEILQFLNSIASTNSGLISLGAFIVSIFGIFISIKVYNKNKFYSIAAIEATICDQIATAKSNLADALESNIVFEDKDKALAKFQSTKLSDAAKELLQSYENACIHFYSGAVNRVHFKSLYTAEISDLFKNSLYTEYLTQNSFPHLEKYHEENKE